MSLPRLLLVPLLMSIWIAPGEAQSPLNLAPPTLPNPFTVQPLPGSRVPPLDFHALAPSAKAGAHSLNPRTLKQLNPFVYRPNDVYALGVPHGAVRLSASESLMAHNDMRCYAIRDYQFSRVAPESDATRLTGSSTCEPAGQVHLKGATAR